MTKDFFFRWSRFFLVSFFLWVALISSGHAQDKSQERYPIQFSGVVMTSDSLIAIPFATVYVVNKKKGTVTNYEGFFSFVAEPGDSLIFACLGFFDKPYVIPPDLRDRNYSVIQLMTRDTIYLPETIIYPWPTREQFREAFLNLNIPDDDLERARKNLEREALKEIGQSMSYDGKENTGYYLRREAEKFYYAGQTPPMNIFNPFAWAQFIEAWRRGDFKNKK